MWVHVGGCKPFRAATVLVIKYAAMLSVSLSPTLLVSPSSSSHLNTPNPLPVLMLLRASSPTTVMMAPTGRNFSVFLCPWYLPPLYGSHNPVSYTQSGASVPLKAQ